MLSLLKNILLYLFAIVLVKLVGVFSSFFLATLLQPAEYGVWITLLLFLSLSGIFHLGTLEAFVKEYAFGMGRGDAVFSKKVENAAYGSIVITALLILFFGLLYAGSFAGEWTDANHVWIVVLAASVNMLQQFFYYRFMVRQDFRAVSGLEILRSAMAFLFYVSMAWWYGLKGAVAGLLIVELICLGCSYTLSSRIYGRSGIDVNAKAIGQLIKVGFPITVFWWFFMLRDSVDRIISISLLGKTDTGYYGLGISLVSVVVLLPEAIGRVLYPKVNERMGETSNDGELFDYIVLPARVLSLTLPLLIGLLILACPVIYQRILPKYHPGLLSAQILLLGSFFICIVRNAVNYLIATDRQQLLLQYVFVSLLCNVVLSVTAVQMGYYLEGIALSAAVSGFLLATLVWKSVFGGMKHQPADQWRHIFHLYAPFVLMSAMSGIVMHAMNRYLAAVETLVFSAVSLIILFAALLWAIPLYKSWILDAYRPLHQRINEQGGLRTVLSKVQK